MTFKINVLNFEFELSKLLFLCVLSLFKNKLVFTLLAPCFAFIMEEDQIKSSSHKGEKGKSYPLKFKLDTISYAETNGNRAAKKKFKVDRKRIREWCEKEASIEHTVRNKKSKGSQRKRIEGGGRKPFA